MACIKWGDGHLSAYGQYLLEMQQRDKAQGQFGANVRKAKLVGPASCGHEQATTLGRKPALSEHQRQEIICLSQKGKVSLKQLARQYAVSHMTIYRVTKEAKDTKLEGA